MAEQLGAPARVQLLAYVQLVARWNRVFNLTAIRDPLEMVSVHLIDSLALVPLLAGLPAGALVVDVGSGGGLPGIPLQIARPDLQLALVEPVAKKAAFLRQCRAELGLSGLVVHEARVEDLVLEREPALVTSRAFASLADFVVAADAIAGPDTRVLAMKAARVEAELAEFAERGLPWLVREVRELLVPGLAAWRCVVVLTRAAADASSDLPEH